MSRTRERLRVAAMLAALLACCALVTGQIESLPVQPDGFPAPQAGNALGAWYRWVLPAQIAVLMLMSCALCGHASGRGVFWPSKARTRHLLRWGGAVYAAAIAILMGVAASRLHDAPLGGDLLLPLGFHAVLAGFIWLAGAARAGAAFAGGAFAGAAAPHAGEPQAYTDLDLLDPCCEVDLLERIGVDGQQRILHVSCRELLRSRRLLDA